ncbi:MAG TPA: sugar phosphate isomerase/epimerase family protein [Lunatimonas sp.]|nr:sugar phosphate isomerase/epimerase family protein [Lunatimonas sp.]
MPLNINPSRRSFLKRSMILSLVSTTSLINAVARPINPHYLFGACDWSIGKTSDVASFALAKEIGLDGLQISLGQVSNNMHLRQPAIQESFLKASRDTGVKIASMAIGELNNVPYKSEAITQEWVHDCIDVAQVLGCQVILLAFFGKGDLRDDPEGKREVIRKLKEVAPKAEKQNIYLAIESWLSAEEHLEIIEAVGSSNVRVYYDVANATEMGYDIYREMRLLGTQYICEIHAKENGNLLGQGIVDFPRVKETLQEIGYANWVIIEGAVPKGADMFPSYVSNRNYLHQLLNT